jgi:hypothetical protein
LQLDDCALVLHDAMSSLLSEYRAKRATMDKTAAFIASEASDVIRFFIEGNVSDRREADAPLVRQVHDHKTSSDVDKYGKTEDGLIHNHQTSMYLDMARFMFGWGTSDNEMLRMSHGYFQTKKKKLFKPVETFVTIPQLDAQLDDTKRVIRAMKHVAAEPDIRKVDKNLAACEIGHGCPYFSRCPRGVSAMTNLLSRFKKPASTPAPAAPPPAAAAAAPKPAAPPPAPAARCRSPWRRSCVAAAPPRIALSSVASQAPKASASRGPWTFSVGRLAGSSPRCCL